MGIIRSGKKSESDGEFEIDRGSSTSLRWTEVTVAVFDENDSPADPNMVTGVLSGQVIKAGSGKREDFATTMNLATDDWSWKPELSTVNLFYFSITGLNSNYTYEVSVNSWAY